MRRLTYHRLDNCEIVRVELEIDETLDRDSPTEAKYQTTRKLIESCSRNINIPKCHQPTKEQSTERFSNISHSLMDVLHQQCSSEAPGNENNLRI